MQNKHDWYENIPLLHLKEDPARTRRIQEQVMQQLPHMAERETHMKQRSALRRIRPLICAAAVIAIGAVSLVTVNAATDGALFTKVTMYINGEKTDFDARMIDQDEDTITYEFVKNDGSNDGENQDGTFRVYEEENGLSLECEGDPGDDVAVEFEIPDSALETTVEGAE